MDFKNKGGFFVTNSELAALDYLKNKTASKSLIMVDNVDKNHWRNAFSYYISFLSDRQIFVDGNGIAQDHGVAVENKIQAVKTVFNSWEISAVEKEVKKYNIDYLYMNSKDRLVSTKSAHLFTEVFQNDQVTILKVKK